MLAQRHALTGHTRAPNDPASLLLSNRGLGVILEIDRDKPVGAVDAAGINDVLSESAVIVPRRTIPTRFDQRARLAAIRSTCRLAVRSSRKLTATKYTAVAANDAAGHAHQPRTCADPAAAPTAAPAEAHPRLPVSSLRSLGPV